MKKAPERAGEHHLPHSLYTAAQVRAFDSEAINTHHIQGFELMKRAGKAAFDACQRRWPTLMQGGTLHIVCGAGNNAGDGFAVAAQARHHYMPVRVLTLRDPELLKGSAYKAWEWFRDLGGHYERWSEETVIQGDTVVDAILGTGLSGDMSADFRQAVAQINEANLPVLSLDIPSGLCPDTGSEKPVAVRADLTVTFVALKRGLYTGSGPKCCGSVELADLHIPDSVYDSETAATTILHDAMFADVMPPRAGDAHKGDQGHLLIIGGDHGKGGAVLMAAQAALRSGVGLVTMLTRPEHVQASLARCPEVMVVGIKQGEQLAPLFTGKTAIVVGPGLGLDSWGEELLAAVLSTELPILLDADALNLVSRLTEPFVPRRNALFTPHVGEAARLLGCTVEEVAADRFRAARTLQSLCGGVVVLKGAGSLVQDENDTCLCSAGNPGMAVAGMGDVLSGIIGALLAQGQALPTAARLGVWLHAVAGDRCAEKCGELGMIATDLLAPVRQLLNELSERSR